jgi:nicotinamide-nucleotide amidase
MVATAESCTGGRIAAALTAEAGASEYFLGGVVAYSNDVKISVLGVSPEALARHGAVSREVACQMASGVRRLTRADFGVATTGIAGPGGGTPEKPVGTVWIAVASPGKGVLAREGCSTDRGECSADADVDVLAREFHFTGSRLEIMASATSAALTMLTDRVRERP